MSQPNFISEQTDVEEADRCRRIQKSLLIERRWLMKQQENVSAQKVMPLVEEEIMFNVSTDRCGSEPAGGVGCKKCDNAGVELVNGAIPSMPTGPSEKSPPRKWRICAFVGLCGVGASRSTMATTNRPVGISRLP